MTEKNKNVRPFKILWGTLEENMQGFLKKLNRVSPSDKYEIKLAVNGYIVNFDDPQKTELESRLIEMGWEITHSEKNSFLVIPERQKRKAEDLLCPRGGNPDYYF